LYSVGFIVRWYEDEKAQPVRPGRNGELLSAEVTTSNRKREHID
jgi:hypothetical protein